MVDVVMPQMGESLTEGTVVSWLKAEGDEVERDEPLLEIDTDKVATTVEAPVAGVLSAILVPEGETVGVDTVLARIDAADGEAAAEAAAAEEPKGHFGGAGNTETVSFRGTRPPAPQPRRALRDDGPRLVPQLRSSADFLSPGVLNFAAEAGVSMEELQSLRGSGPSGRVSRKDLERWLKQRGTAPRKGVAPAPEAARGPSVPDRYLYTPSPRDERQPMSSTRKRIADHMVWSKRISAHTVANEEANVEALVSCMQRRRDDFERQTGVALTYTALIAYAAVRVLGEFPRMNAAVVGDEVVIRPYVHLGMAVATESEGDLIVPVITDADQLPFEVFAHRMHDVVTRARERRLELRELEGGTFTYSNIGAVGGVSGAPIINQPQVAILSTYAIRERPWVVDGEIVVRPVMGLSVSSDHRIVDGLMVFRFLARLVERLYAIEDVIEE